MNVIQAPAAPADQGESPPFRFYDNRQKYLAFVNTCNEKSAIAHRAAQELAQIRPTPPALRLFDAGMGDGTVLARLLRNVHYLFPTVPVCVVAKEISLEDVRLGLEKMPGRFMEHPASVVVVTNLNYADAPSLAPHALQPGQTLNWQQVRLSGTSEHEYAEQIDALEPMLNEGWQTRPSPKTGNPVYNRPTVLVIHRADHEFLLESVIPRPGRAPAGYDLILASQPWRARMSAEFKARTVLAPLTRNLARGGRLLAIQSAGRDPGLELIQRLWPGEDPFKVDRHQLLSALRAELGADADDYVLDSLPDEQAMFRYEMHTLPSEIGDRIGTSTLFAAWNAAIYVNQIEDERLDGVMSDSSYLDATQAILQKHGGLWFNDEAFVVSRRM
jgi:hypothetical protein